MLDFFIALFGGAYMLAKSGQENRIAQRSRMTYDQKMAIRKKVMDWDAIAKIRRRFNEDPYGMLNEIAGDMKFIFQGYDWEKLFHDWPFHDPFLDFSTPAHSIWEIAYNVYLSKHGYAKETEVRTASYHGNMYGITKKANKYIANPILERAAACIQANMIRVRGNDDAYRLWRKKDYSAIFNWGFSIMAENIYANHVPFR